MPNSRASTRYPEEGNDIRVQRVCPYTVSFVLRRQNQATSSPSFGSPRSLINNHDVAQTIKLLALDCDAQLKKFNGYLGKNSLTIPKKKTKSLPVQTAGKTRLISKRYSTLT